MSWFASLAPAALVPAETKPAQEEPPPPSSVPAAAPLPVEQSSGKPRAKAPALRAKVLPRWEAPSDDEDADNFTGHSPNSGIDIAPPRASTDAGVSEVATLNSADGYAAAVHSMAPLKSYEESVLQLKPVRHHEFREDKEESSSENEPQDTAAAQKKLQQELKMREKLLEEEKLEKQQNHDRDNKMGLHALTASRAIVSVARTKLHLMDQKMKAYTDAESQGTDNTLRTKKLLGWVASLSVLQRFEEKMQQPEMQEAITQMYLAKLPPPPPPPPMEEPPDSEDEELHEKYEAMINRYEKQWKTEGQRVLGKERFEEIRKMPRNGPADREKKIIAQRCLQQAGEVLNEGEYQELLRKAWRLGDDHAAFSEYDPVQFARRVANAANGADGSKATSKKA